VATTVLDVGKPTSITKAGKLATVLRRITETFRLVHVRLLDLHVCWHLKDQVCAVCGGTFPHEVVLNERENFLVGHGVGVRNRGEQHLPLNDPGDEISHQTERYVGDAKVRL